MLEKVLDETVSLALALTMKVMSLALVMKAKSLALDSETRPC